MHISIQIVIYLSISSPYLLVFGDNRVMRYTRSDDVIGGTSEA